MRNRRQLLAAGALLVSMASGGCVARNVVVKIDPANRLDKKEGVFYALPRTVVAAAVPVKKVTLKKGAYERFAACFFPDDENAERIVHTNCKIFELGDPVITTRAEPDPAEIYMVKIRGRYFEDKSLTLALSESGVPTKITEETTNRAVEILTQLAQTGTSLILRNAKFAANDVASEEETDLNDVIRSLDPSVPVCVQIKIDLERLRNALRALNQAKSDLIQATSELTQVRSASAKPAEIKASEDNLRAKQDALAQRAATFDSLDPNGDVLNAIKLYKQILALQEQRKAMVLGIPLGQATGDAVRTALDEIDKLIAALKSKFIGTKSTEKIWIANFELTPTDRDVGALRDFRLFELSPSSGVCGTPPLDPLVRFTSLNVPRDFVCPSSIPPDCEGEVPRNKIVSIRLTRDTDQLYAKIRDSFGGNSESGDRGFYYRIPAVATAVVRLDDKNLFKTELRVAQLGLTASLPPSTGGRRTKYELEFYETGAMKNFVLGSDALIQASTVKDLGEAAGNVIDARKEAEKKEAAAKDEAAKAKSLSDLLESCKKIRDAQIALGREPILPAICNQ